MIWRFQEFQKYLLVFGAERSPSALLHNKGSRGAPPNQDLVPVIEDSIHFFYISDVLNAFSGDLLVHYCTAPGELLDFVNLVKTGRTYLAFTVDLILFICFQKFCWMN